MGFGDAQPNAPISVSGAELSPALQILVMFGWAVFEILDSLR
jgi:hypothetical protein